MNKDQNSSNIKKKKNLKSSLYQEMNVALLKADNFLHNVRREEIVINVINIHKVNYLIKN